jgi:hypothetical protein
LGQRGNVNPSGSGPYITAMSTIETTATGRQPRFFFTEAGLAALHAMMADRRFANRVKFAHVRQELGLND